MKNISDNNYSYIQVIYRQYVIDKMVDDEWLLVEVRECHDSIKIIQKINDLIELGRDLEISFWEVVKTDLGNIRFEEVKALHKKCRMSENKRQ
jgi:hypothetical protein